MLDDVHSLLTSPELSKFAKDVVIMQTDGNAYDINGNKINSAKSFGFDNGKGAVDSTGMQTWGFTNPAPASVPQKIYFFEGNVAISGTTL